MISSDGPCVVTPIVRIRGVVLRLRVLVAVSHFRHWVASDGAIIVMTIAAWIGHLELLKGAAARTFGLVITALGEDIEAQLDGQLVPHTSIHGDGAVPAKFPGPPARRSSAEFVACLRHVLFRLVVPARAGASLLEVALDVVLIWHRISAAEQVVLREKDLVVVADVVPMRHARKVWVIRVIAIL